MAQVNPAPADNAVGAIATLMPLDAMPARGPMPLDDILEYGHHLPPFPRVVTELLATFKRENCTADEIAKIISTDPVLSARILRLANSAFYKRSRTITSVRNATVVIGYVPLRLLVAGLGVAAGVAMPKGLDKQRFWRFSLHTAAIARHLAQKVAADAETAFSAGLLHRVGHPVMRGSMAEACDRLETTTPFYARDRAAVERQHWGFDYADVGAGLGEMWSFPPALIEPIRDSAFPLKAKAFSPVTGVVRLAAEMASGLENGLAQAQTVAFIDVKLMQRLNLSADHVRGVPPVAELTAGMDALLESA